MAKSHGEFSRELPLDLDSAPQIELGRGLQSWRCGIAKVISRSLLILEPSHPIWSTAMGARSRSAECIPDSPIHPFKAHRLNSLVFLQGAADSVPHTLFVDDIRIEEIPHNDHAPQAPRRVEAKGYERHIDISWQPVDDPNLAQYVIYRSVAGAAFQPIGVQRPGVNRFCDYTGDPHMTASYRVTARTSTLRESSPSAAVKASTSPMTDDQLLTMVQEASFRYYWEAAEPHSGMTRENTPGNDDIVALGASGFGIMAIVAGAERGFITHQQATDRLLRITSFLATADRYRGAWPHFLSGSTGKCLPVFGIHDNGADLVETSFLMEGLLAARQYFKADGPSGHELYQRITSLWEGVDWTGSEQHQSMTLSTGTGRPTTPFILRIG